MRKYSAQYIRANNSPEEAKELLATLSPSELDHLLHDWQFWARDEQLWPEEYWAIWAIITGRGWGKTRTGAENLIDAVRYKGYRYPIMLAPVKDDIRDTMIEGESGILNCCPDDFRPHYTKSPLQLTWKREQFPEKDRPDHDVKVLCLSADEPERIRGKQGDYLWIDEFGSLKNARYVVMNLMMGIRLGNSPRTVITTTPPNDLRKGKGALEARLSLRELLKRPNTHLTTGTSYDNKDNLSAEYFENNIRPYEGTEQGRIEIHGELIDYPKGALFKKKHFDDYRVGKEALLTSIAVAVDPNASDSETADAMGLVAGGVAREYDQARGKTDQHLFVTDSEEVRGAADFRIRTILNYYHKLEANVIVIEKNNGGDWIPNAIMNYCKAHDIPIPAMVLVHASRGKLTRAEPTSVSNSSGLIHLVGDHAELEDECCMWQPGDESPNLLDAFVWLETHFRQPQELDIWS